MNFDPGGTPQLIKKFQMALVKNEGIKSFKVITKLLREFYRFTSFIPKKNLLRKYGKEGEIYGAGAFVMNYPNPHDRLMKKTGSGIWLHSTNDETRIEKGRDSRGCVVVANNDPNEISTFIELEKTSIIVVDKIQYLKKETWLKEKKNSMIFRYMVTLMARRKYLLFISLTTPKNILKHQQKETLGHTKDINRRFFS